MLELKVKKLNPNATIPTFGSKKAACFDLYACIPDGQVVVVNASSPSLIGTGLAFGIPEGYEMQVRPRSGMSVKNGMAQLPTVGTVDADFIGEVCVGLQLIRPFCGEVMIHHGDRIAQACLKKVEPTVLIEVDELDQTERGTGGFGSTGV